MVTRSEDLQSLLKIVGPYLPIRGFDPFLWLLNPRNVCLKEGDNLTLFEYEEGGVYAGHIFFTSRGRDAVNLSRKMLSHFFENYPVKAVIGYTPMSKKGALWLMRQLGFQDEGSIVLNGDEVNQVWSMTSDDYKRIYNG